MGGRNVETELQKSAHAVYRTKYHLVWIPKYRKKLLISPIQQRLKIILQGIAERYGFDLDTMSIQEDHIYLFVSFPPKFSISKVVQIFKGTSSWRLRKESPELDEMLWDADFWAPGFYASTVNDRTTTEQIRRYIQNQEYAKNQPIREWTGYVQKRKRTLLFG